MKTLDNQQQLALWMPYEFFLQSALAEPGTKREDIEKSIALLRPYQLMLVECKFKGPTDITVQSEEGIRKRASLTLTDGHTILPLHTVPESITTAIKEIKAMMVPITGGNEDDIHILIFPTMQNGETLVNSTRKQTVTLNLTADAQFAAVSFTWRTPFDALTPLSYCPKCHEHVSAKWHYCPWCGLKLAD
ncbi:MAG TPA: zinc ribbon domain-containing protein [Armatimonadota bacterium]|nr:zinc ribbon domain-containing protein [Armatimonadota bacterium]